jgi:hypothetical protein
MSFTQQVITGSAADGEYVYYNATVVNNTVVTTQRTDDPVCNFEDTRVNPILKDVSKYVVSVDSFSLDGVTKSFPLLIPQIKPATLTASITASAVSADGTTITYTVSTGLQTGMKINSISGFSTTGYNQGEVFVISSTSTTITLSNSNRVPIGTATGTGTLTYPDPTDINTTIYTVTFGVTIGTGTGTSTGSGNLTTFQSTIPVQWVTENQSPFYTAPSTANPRQAETNYYYLYSYQHWVGILNNALIAAWRDVMYKCQVEKGFGGTQCPFFEYNQNTGLFSICQDSLTCWIPYGQTKQAPNSVVNSTAGVSDWSYPFAAAFTATTTLNGRGQGTGTSTGSGTGTGTTGAANHLTSPYGEREFSYVGMNANMEGLMTNFDTIFYSANSVSAATGGFTFAPTSGKVTAPSAVSWTARNAGNLFYPENVINVVPDARPECIFVLPQIWADSNPDQIYYIRETQDYISTGTLWSPIASLVLGTAQIPIRKEVMANPVQIGGSSLGGTTSGGASQKVLLEVPIDAVTADLWRGNILYKPLTPIFSAMDSSQDALQVIDINLGWRNRLTNQVIPCRLYNSGSVTYRLRFIRK